MTTDGTETGVLGDPVAEADRILDAAAAARVPVRAIGGVAIALRAPVVRTLFPERAYHDLDLVAPGGRRDVTPLLESLGYQPQRRFNTLNGAERLLFHDATGRRVDVFIDRLRMCHELRLGDRLAIDARTLPLADLLLSKLQIVERTERDRQDIVALLVGHQLSENDADGISVARVRAVCGADWGWWRTVVAALDEVVAWSEAQAGDSVAAFDVASARAADLRAQVVAAPRSMAWRLRALVGERRRWYDLPEEVR